MKPIAALALLITLAAATDLEVLERGRYSCAAPGDAMGPAYHSMSEHDFDVTLGSSYSTESGKGTYLLTGVSLIFTSGPFKHERFHRTESGLWQAVDKSGNRKPLSCNRVGPAS